MSAGWAIFLINLFAVIAGLIIWHRKIKFEQQRKDEEAKKFIEQIDSLAVAVEELRCRYDTLLDFEYGYLMKHDYDELVVAVAPIAKKLLTIPEQHRNSHGKSSCINKLLTYYSTDNLREQRNSEYKAHELTLCAELFDDINGKSLDPQQRDAIVTDEYSNLVIAGAGSGKTLTVVGKLKYLVERWEVNPADILVTSFTRKSVDELTGRITAAGITGVSTRTFHALGLSVLDKPGVAGLRELDNCILRYLNSEILKSAEQVQAYLEFYGCYSYISEDHDTLEDAGEMYQELKSKDLVTLQGQLNKIAQDKRAAKETLQGERVSSVEELKIANHLFLNGVNYEYEKVYMGTYQNKGRRAYQPDFYLTDYDIWLEHFGIDENGCASFLATEFEQKKYHDEMLWKREVHTQNGTKLIESYSFWDKDNGLIEQLNSLLADNGVKLEQDLDLLLSHYERLRQDEKFSKSILRLISTAVSLFKASDFSIEAVDKKAEDAYRDNSYMMHRYRLFMAFTAPIINFYQCTLREKGLIDFDDMINHATRAIRDNGIQNKYRYIIVDEYQDISMSRFGLISAIRDCTEAKLICVGDDWQSIYRFAGSDVTLFMNFEEFCGFYEEMRIENTYRNSQSLINSTSKFVAKNPHQLPKSMTSKQRRQNQYPITALSQKDQADSLAWALDDIFSTDDFDGGKVYVLGRHNFDIDSLFPDCEPSKNQNCESGNFSFRKDSKTGDIQISYKDYSNITYMSVHRSKGLEADDVIILNLINDKYGFPNKIANDPILNLLLADSDEYPYAEERRLFYVAITRTKNRAYLIANHVADYKGTSVFLNELFDDDDVNSIQIVSEAEEQPAANCPRCGSGILLARQNSKTGKEFLGCINYPFCEKTYSDIRILDRQVKCPKCSGWMVERTGKHGSFYGCTNYPECKG